MSSEADLEIRLTYLEDQLNRMNLVLAGQVDRNEELTSLCRRLSDRLKALEGILEGGGTGDNTYSPSEMPPDGVNR